MNSGKRLFIKASALSLILVFLLQGCAGDKLQNENGSPEGSQLTDGTSMQLDRISQQQVTGQNINNTPGTTTEEFGNSADVTKEHNITTPATDLHTVKPNETGKIMVVMFHNFVEEYKKGDKAYTTTFDAFEKLLDTLYASSYRLISMNDYLKGNIDTPAGCIPMLFTFDDGTAGQFNLIEEGEALVANPRSAVGILEKFNKTHPDFGTKGTFYINLGNQTFSGAGTVSQRLEYLKSKGFELGNHTYTHINLKETKTAAKIQEEIGGNQKKMAELIPNYTFTTFSLPYGAPSKDLTEYVIRGEYEGIKYENLGIMEVGWDPAPSPFSVKFNPLSTHRVRASGITPVDADLAWWLDNLKLEHQYVSDGNAATVAVPEISAEYVDQSRLNGRQLVTY